MGLRDDAVCHLRYVLDSDRAEHEYRAAGKPEREEARKVRLENSHHKIPITIRVRPSVIGTIASGPLAQR
jgi:hypothetical protein